MWTRIWDSECHRGERGGGGYTDGGKDNGFVQSKRKQVNGENEKK